MQMLSDVKLGCQLSGGIDSSLVTLFATESIGEQLDAVSVIMDDQVYSEEAWIDEAARQAGVQVHKFRLAPEWFANNFMRCAWHLDQPINHPNTLGILFLAQNAKSKVTVLLSGEGADELLGGYPRFFYQATLRKHTRLIQSLSRLPRIGPWIADKFQLGRDERDSLILSTARMDASMATRLLPQFKWERALDSRRRMLDRTSGSTFLRRYLNYEMATYLQDLLIRQDKMTMAEGIENRVPFLDHRLVEYVRSIPDADLVSTKFRLGRNAVEKNTKNALKALSEKYFGRDFTYRKKSGFALPLREFLGSDGFRPIAEQLLSSISARGLFDASFVRQLWSGLGSASAQEVEVVWMMFSFEAWASQFDARSQKEMS